MEKMEKLKIQMNSASEKQSWDAEKQKLQDQLKKAEMVRASLAMRTNLGKFIISKRSRHQ